MKFGSSKRQEFVSSSASEIPGPGNYSSELGAIRESGPKYTFTGRQDQKYNDHPGPGQYDESTKLTKTHGGSLKFGSS